MSITHGKIGVAWLVLVGSVCVPLTGCGDPIVSSGIAHPGTPAVQQSPAPQPEVKAAPAVVDAPQDARVYSAQAVEPAVAVDPARPREFPVEGTEGALRITFDDLDLMKLLNMDPVTPDCVEKMPTWLKELSGKRVRIRGFMKPVSVTEGLPAFPFVRSTDMCCFGPKGKVYHMIAVTLKPGLTTDYIELKPFDVEGRFKIEKLELDDGLIFLLYHIDDAVIIRS
jgi:hypothetical protein